MWLLKTEPSTYAFADLEREGRTVWDGVNNPAALAHLRAMQAGDQLVVYHTGAEKAAVGLARVVKGDPGRIPRVAIEVLRRLPRPVTLAEIKASSLFASSALVRQGRLSVVPLDAAQFDALERGEL